MKFYKIIIWFFLMIFSINFAYAKNIEDIFTDISTNYNYYDELQFLYDNGVFIPDVNNKFNPSSILQRDEFVWSVVELSCDKCIHPNSSIKYILKYQNSNDLFYDVNKNNPYFYCIAWAKDNKIVQWYDVWYTCSNGTNDQNKVPFCPDNAIQRQEALAVLLRRSNLLSIEEANAIKQNSFEPYLQKALEVQSTTYNSKWEQKTYKLYTSDLDPAEYITKEEFLKMSFIIANVSPCKTFKKVESTISSDILIYDKICNSSMQNCEESDLKDEKIFDFKAKVWNICSSWIKEYKWIFYNQEFWIIQELEWKYIDDFTFSNKGLRNIRMIAEDNCWNVTHSYSSIRIWDNWSSSNELSVDIIADPISGDGPLNVNFEAITTWCDEWCSYLRDFKNGATSTQKNPTQNFNDFWVYEATLEVTDSEGNIAKSLISINVTKDASIWSQIFIYEKSCYPLAVNCVNSDLSDSEWIYDFKSDIEKTCISWIKSNNWIFTHTVSWDKLNYSWEYLDNIELGKYWERDIKLITEDNCWKSSISKSTIYKIDSENDVNSLILQPSVQIIADPIYGKWPLNVNFESILSNCQNCVLNWDFWDWVNSSESNPTHTFNYKWIYIVELVATEENWNKSKAYITININDDTLDSDGDWVFDINDKCVYIPWEVTNNGCPIIDKVCNVDADCSTWYLCNQTKKVCKPNLKEDLIWSCIYPVNKSSIFGNISCNTCPCNYKLQFNSNLRKCDVLIPSIISQDWTEIYSAWDWFQIPYK